MNKESLKIPNEWTREVWKYQMNEKGKFENTKWVVRKSKSAKDSQYNGQKKPIQWSTIYYTES
jgi:hypothetical protein